MISDVVITGYLRKQMKGDRRFRYFETKSIDALTGDTLTSFIPIMYWTRDENNILDRYENGTFAIIKGRIEVDDSIGLYVLVELFQVSDRIAFS